MANIDEGHPSLMSNIDEVQPKAGVGYAHDAGYKEPGHTEPVHTTWNRDAARRDHDIDQDDYDAMSPSDREALPPEVLADLGPDAIADRLRPKIDLDKVAPEERHHVNLAHDVVHALGLDTTFFNIAHILGLMRAEGIEPAHTTAANEYPKHVKVGVTNDPDERGVITQRGVYVEVNDADEEAKALSEAKSHPDEVNDPAKQAGWRTEDEAKARHEGVGVEARQAGWRDPALGGTVANPSPYNPLTPNKPSELSPEPVPQSEQFKTVTTNQAGWRKPDTVAEDAAALILAQRGIHGRWLKDDARVGLVGGADCDPVHSAVFDI